MPRIKSAKKALKASAKKRAENLLLKKKLKSALDKLENSPKEKQGLFISETVSCIDKAVKNNLLHRNKAAHMKAAIAKKFKSVKAEKLTKKVQPAKKAKTTKKISKSKKQK